MYYSIRISFLVAVFFVKIPLATGAPKTQVISLETAINLALKNNAGIQASTLETERQNYLSQQENIRLNPEIDFSLTTVDERRTEVGISQEIELGGKRAYRLERGKSNLEISNLDLEISKTELIRRIKIHFYQAYSLQAKELLYQEALAIAKTVVKTTQKRHRSGASPKVEVTSAKLTLTAVEFKSGQNKENLRSKLYSLTRLLGDVKDTNYTIDLTAKLPEKMPSIDSLRSKLGMSPYLARKKAKESLGRSMLQLENAKRYPNLTVGASYSHDSQTEAKAVELSVSMPVPIYNRNQGNVSAALTRIRQAKLETKQTEAELLIKLSDSYRRLKNNFFEFQLNRKSILPESKRTFLEIKKLYNLGRQSYLSLSAAQKNYLDVQMSQIQIHTNFYINLADLESLLSSSKVSQIKNDKEALQ